MGKKLKKNEKKKTKILKAIDRLKNKITAKEKKLSKVNIKIAGLELLLNFWFNINLNMSL